MRNISQKANEAWQNQIFKKKLNQEHKLFSLFFATLKQAALTINRFYQESRGCDKRLALKNFIQQYFFSRTKLMLKVVLVLRQIVLRLKEGDLGVFIKKHKDIVVLGSQLKLIEGLCQANLTSEFYLSRNDTSINLQVVVMQGANKKLGGNTLLNLLDYEQAVYHQTISVLHNSPDKQARILFNFVYFNDASIFDKRHMFLSSDRYQEEYQNIQKKNSMLLSQNRQLQKELCKHEIRNQALTMMKEERQLVLKEKEQAFKDQLQMRQKNIDDCNQKYEQSRLMKQGLLELVKAKGFTRKQEL